MKIGRAMDTGVVGPPCKKCLVQQTAKAFSYFSLSRLESRKLSPTLKPTPFIRQFHPFFFSLSKGGRFSGR